MADKKISELTNITGANLADGDELVVVDASASETKAITFGEFKTALDTSTGFVRITGDTMTGDLSFGDNDKAIFGAGSDLQIYHDGSNSYIQDTGTGDLFIKASDQIRFQSVTTGEYYAVFNENGSVVLRYDGDEKFSTTSTGVDITGTLTSDGLTVNGTNDVALITTNQSNYTEGLTLRNTANWGYGTSLSFETITSSGGSNAEVGRIQSTWLGAGYQGFDFYVYNNNSLLRQMRLAGNGDLSLYEDTGTTAKFFWDASAESLGIGTSSPSSYWANADDLVVATSGNTGISVVSGTTSLGYLIFADSTAGGDNTRGGLGYDHSTNDMLFRVNNDTKMRIDSSGNLLVGKTADNLTDAGQVFTTTGSSFTRNGGTACQFNRNTSDGEIVRLSKDGTTVGSIGVAPSNRLYIGNSDAGLRFLGDSNLITPWNPSTNSNSDNLLDLGNSANRWKDVYVGGGVYLGGTGSANHLDDYEEGTWTPTLNFGGNATGMAFTTQSGSYVKIGQVVTAQFRIELSSKGVSTGNANFGGLPFNATSVGTLYPTFYGLHHDVNSGSGNTTANVLPIGQIGRTTNDWNYYQADSTTPVTDAYFNNNTVINGTVTFRVN